MKGHVVEIIKNAAKKLEENREANRRARIKKALDELDEAIIWPGYVEGHLLHEVLLGELPERISVLCEESAPLHICAFFHELKERYAELCAANDAAVRSAEGRESFQDQDALFALFQRRQNEFCQWLERAMPEEIPEFMQDAYKELVRNYNSAFWGKF